MLTLPQSLAEKIQQAAHRANLPVETYLEQLVENGAFSPIIENLPDIIYTFSAVTRKVDFINRETFLGYSFDELTKNNSLFANVLPEDTDRLYQHWLAITSGSPDDDTPLNFQIKDTDGDWHWMKMRHVVLSRQADQTPEKILIHLTDVTNIKQAERDALKNEQRLESIITAMSEGIVFHRADGSIELCNESAQHILGLSEDQMMGRTSVDPQWRAVREDGTPFPGEEHPAMLTLQTGEPASNVIMGVHKPDGELTWISINTQPLFQNGETQPYAVVATFTNITRQKRQESQLRVLMQAVEQSPVSVVITDTNANITYINTQFSKLTGYTLEEVVQQNPRILQSGFTPPETFKQMWTSITNGEVWQGEMINRKKNGDIYYEHAIIAPIRNSHGETTHFVAVKEDITERKQFEEALQASEREAREFQEYLKTLHEMSLKLARINSLDALYQQAVETGLQQLGFDRVALFLIDYQNDSVVGTYGTDTDGNLRPEFGYESSLQVQAHWVNEVLRNKERAILWEEAPLIDYDVSIGSGWNAMAGLWDGDHAIGFFAVDNYLSGRPPRAYERELLSLYGKTIGHLVARQRALQALQQSEQRVRTLMQHTPICIIVSDMHGHIESTNSQTASLLGYEEADRFTGQNIHTFLPALPSDDNLSTFKSLHLGLEHDFFATHHDGSAIPVEVVMTTIALQDEPRLVFFMNDLSPHKEVEQQRLQLAIEKERSNVLARFIQDASHEFRTPLTVIKNRSFLIQSVTEDEKISENVEKIDTQVDRIVSLVEDLAYIAQLDSKSELVLESHNIIDVIQAAVQGFQAESEARNIKLTFSSSYKIPKVRLHVYEFKEALVRIINNAIRYNREGGQINISCLHVDDEVVIEIKDTGTGIDPNYLPHIFERFYRMDSAHTTRGFGLGLSIAQKIVSLHHGTITAESEPGVGTTIRLTLPV